MAVGEYFDPSGSSDDLKLLPARFRDKAELAELADVVTNDIVNRFTHSTYRDGDFIVDANNVVISEALPGAVKVADFTYITLRGYAEDPVQADARFRDAFRREIAAVLIWRLAQLEREPGVESHGDQQVTKGMRENADDTFPAAFPRYLGPYIVEPPVWSF